MQQIKYRKLSEIKLLPNNPRFIKDKQFETLCRSIGDNPEYFEARPIILSDRTGELIIIAGNQRYRAAEHIKLKQVPTYLISGLTEEKEQEIIIRDNISNGEWDWDILGNTWDADKLDEWGLEVPGFFVKQAAEEDNYEVPEIETVKTAIKYGDLIEIGHHRLMCGDSTKEEDVKKLMNGKKFDCIITDAPYNVALGVETVEQAKKRNRRIDGLVVKNDKMKDSDFAAFLLLYFTNMFSFSKEGASVYAFFADMELKNFTNSFLDGGFKLSQMIVWKKSSLIMGRKDYQSMHEPILYGWKEGAAHNWYSDRKQTTILEFDKPNRNKEHPTMKPVELVGYLAKNSSKENDLIGDGFLGSGTTMVAAHQLKRVCFGMELDEKYCQVIIDRMIKLDAELMVKVNGKDYMPK